jgi:hypothetical protein
MSEKIEPVSKKADRTLALVKKLISEQFSRWTDLEIKPVVLSGNDNHTFRRWQILVAV